MKSDFDLKKILLLNIKLVFLITIFIFLLNSACTKEHKIVDHNYTGQTPASQEQDIGEIPYGTPPIPLNLEEVRLATPYPETAKKFRIEGIVYLKLLIDRWGIVKRVELVESLDPILDEVAIEMVKQLRFRPAEIENKPVAVWLSFPFKFSLYK
ncbi:energy transducer TonB [candidate division WOR-3 bacterium]|nr:energy transducer TonB [candidate division WOR-3 bacterium]